MKTVIKEGMELQEFVEAETSQLKMERTLKDLVANYREEKWSGVMRLLDFATNTYWLLEFMDGLITHRTAYTGVPPIADKHMVRVHENARLDFGPLDDSDEYVPVRH
ncbi:MAG: hypothetical protein NXH95_00730 [Pseudomonadaceae bacterium]|nr:hypothetical protein [Pseudomonadaceae bacterium]